MRLTKQLKAQANSIRFASQIPTSSDFIANHHPTNKQTVNHDLKPILLTSNIQSEEPISSAMNDQNIPLQTPANNFNQNLPGIIPTSHSDGYLTDEKQKLSIRYNYDEDDSLNSSFLREEPIML